MSNYWFTADTHFGHKRTLELSKRPYNSIEEMNWDMVKKWNERVKKGDTVYHLGDFGDFDFAKHLNGDIILLYGNYEHDDKNLDGIEGMCFLETEKGFYLADSNKRHFIELNGREYELVHEPTNATKDSFYLFGHIHGLQKVKRNGLNVGVDCHNFTPISLQEVEFYRNAIEKHYDEEVFSL